MLLIGGDGQIGARLASTLRARGHRVLATTRTPARADADRPFLDLSRQDAFDPPAAVDRACILAAATTFERCENDPEARRLNVEWVPSLACRLLARGMHVTFLSTNAVFGGRSPCPAEDDPHDPQAAYPRQKSEGEAAIRHAAARLGATDRCAIVRLTKVLSPYSSPVPGWRQAWSRGEVARPFSDLVFAPISLSCAARALAVLLETGPAGNFHLSGEGDVDYGSFARTLAARLGVRPGLVEPAASHELGMRLAFAPRYSALSMARTSRLTGLVPQSLHAVIDDLSREDPPSDLDDAGHNSID